MGLKIEEIRKMKFEDLIKKENELRLELFKEIGNVKMRRPIKNPGKIRALKRAIARIETVKREKGEERSN